MSRMTIGWGCVALTLVGYVASGQLAAQQVNPFGSQPVRQIERAAPDKAKVEFASRHSTDDAVQRINAALDQRLRTPLDYDGEQLNIILEAIADEYDIPIVFDTAALDEVAISPESEVSTSLRNVSLRSALNLLLKEPGLEELCYDINEEVLLVTTEEKRNQTLAVRVYRVDDLLDAASRRFNATNPYGDPGYLIDLIVASVEHDSWQKNGRGEGEIRFYPPGMIVVSQTRRVHDEIAKLFDKLRSTKRQILEDAAATASTDKPATQGFVIDIELGDDAEQVQQRLATAIKSSVDWSAGASPEQDSWIEVLPNRVLVHHRPEVLRQVAIVLADMQIVESDVGGGTSAGGGFGGGGGGGFF